MGKQLYFVHMEEDISEFLCAISEFNGIIIVNGKILEQSVVLPTVLSEMNNHRHVQYLIISSKNIALSKHPNVSIVDGTAIEFSNSHRWIKDSKVYYDGGRIYLRPNSEGAYDKDLLLLFEKLQRYIKKKYSYHKNAGIYLSPIFMDAYNHRNAYYSQLGKPFDL